LQHKHESLFAVETQSAALRSQSEKLDKLAKSRFVEPVHDESLTGVIGSVGQRLPRQS